MERTRQLQEARARHAEQQFDKMCDCMLKVVHEAQGRLVPEERHMLYIAYKCAVGEQRHILKHNPGNSDAVNQINAFCGELIKVLTSDLIPNGADDESKAFYYKIMGDFYRYLDNVGPSEDRKSQAQMAYQTAYDLSQRLPVCHPLRLNTALNFGVFYHEARGQCRMAYDITKTAIDNARPALVSLPEQERTEASFVIDLMLDNLKSWGRELGLDGAESGRGSLPAVRSSSGAHSTQQGGHHTYHFNATGGTTRGGVTQQQYPGGYTPAHTPALGPTGVQTGAVYY